MRLRRSWMAMLSACLLQAGCGGDGESGDGTSKATEFGYQVSPQTMRLIEGQRAYEIYCIGCHGAKGDGNGHAARVMIPRPRNFVKASFKFISTRFGEPPTDEDLFRTISTGLRGSAMPSWGHLPEETRRGLVAYIKTFSEIWAEGQTSAIPVVTDPYIAEQDKSAAIVRGEMAYHGFFTCWNCHPAYVSQEKISEYMTAMGGRAKEIYRLDIAHSAPKKDSNGETIFAPNFHRDYIKSGTSVVDLYRTIGAGITGTAMPTWIDSVAADMAPRDADGNLLVSQADIWAIAYYVQDLAKHREVKFAANDISLRLNRKVTIGAEAATYDYVVEDATSTSGEEEEFFDDDEEEED